MKRRLLQQQTQHVSFGFERENLKISDVSSCFSIFLMCLILDQMPYYINPIKIFRATYIFFLLDK